MNTFSSSAEGTPPERQALPLTPPATDDRKTTRSLLSPVIEVLNYILERRSGRTSGELREFRITLSEYKDLRKRLEEDPPLEEFARKLQIDYNSFTKVLKIRAMKGPVHEYFIEQLQDEIKAQLRRLRNGNDEAARFAAQIFSLGSRTINLGEFDSDDIIDTDQPRVDYSPDGQLYHADAAYPGVVIEVARSQSIKDVEKKAWDYILYSGANVKVVLGFDLGPSKKSKEATVSIWQPRYTIEDAEGLEILDVQALVDREPFRSSDGSAANPEKLLQFPLDSFAPSSLVKFDSQDMFISIPYARLAEFLDSSDRVAEVVGTTGKRGTGVFTKRPAKKRLRSVTPEEQISSTREMGIHDAELKTEKRLELEDGDFQTRSMIGVDIPERRRSKRAK